ncbi:MAG: helix-hairpin-helix domain-containing protein, partial [Oscillibacter sp.]|nr:helix-hairpin-helix domain-containing protein [Oscillibacter sp.]
ASSESAPAPDASGLVNINTAGAAELRALPGVGDALAGRIVAYREEHGAFARIEDVMRVSGIGQGKFDAMKDLITV